MAFCSNCGTALENDAAVCPNCGETVNKISEVNSYVDPADHTAEFDPADISCNKVIALMPYLMGVVGVIIALLAQNKSPYVAFHVRQALKLTVVKTLVGMISVILCWTVLVPMVGGACLLILLVLRVIAFIQVCCGKAKEIPIVGSLGFLK